MHKFIKALLTWFISLPLGNRNAHRKPVPREYERSLQFVVQCGDITIKANHMKTAATRNHGPITFTISCSATDGVVEKPLAPPAWTATVPGTSDLSPLVTIESAADGMSATATLAGTDGNATITVTADGISATADLVIAPLPIAAIVITSDVPDTPAVPAAAA